MKLREIVVQLEKHYGRPEPPRIVDPFEMILFESIGYLVDDRKREAAFKALKAETGLDLTNILSTPQPLLVEIAKLGGILAETRADKLREIAEIARDEFGGDLKKILQRSPDEAKRALRKFPGIGEPGSDKILLYNRIVPTLALDSNALRALIRLGLAEEKQNYSASYKSAQKAAEGERDYNRLIRASQLLRRHGQELCRRSDPLCMDCPLKRECPYTRR